MHRGHHRLAHSLAVAVLGVALLARTASAQFDDPPPPTAYVLQNVTLVRADGVATPNLTIIVRRGFIEAIGTGLEIPADAEPLEGDSLFIYPGIIDAHGAADAELPEPEVDRQTLESWDAPREVQGFTPHRRVADFLTATGESLRDARTQGIVAGAVHPDGPVMPGRSALLLYRVRAGRPDDLVLRPDLGLVFSLEGAAGVYPGTLFGVVAFLRQSLEDARHDGLVRTAHGRDPRGMRSPSWDPDLERLRAAMAGDYPVFFAASTAEDIRLALELADEYGFRPVILGGEEAWRSAQTLRERDVPVLVSVDFPEPERWTPAPEAGEAPDSAEAETPAAQALDVAAEREKARLEELYANAGRLAAVGVRFALTSGGGEADILGGTRKAIEYGLSEDQALRALTQTPAALLSVPFLNRVEPGMPATFIVANGPLFAEGTKILHTFVEGDLQRGRTAAAEGEEPSVDITGSWEIRIQAEGQSLSGTMTLEQQGADFSGSVALEIGTLRVEDGTVSGNALSFSLVINIGGESMTAEVKGTVEGDEASGRGSGPMGSFTWKATKSGTPGEGATE